MFTDAEISELDFSIAVEEDVIRLDISMHLIANMVQVL